MGPEPRSTQSRSPQGNPSPSRQTLLTERIQLVPLLAGQVQPQVLGHMPAELLHGGGHIAARLPLALQHQGFLTAGLRGRHGRSRRGLSSPFRSRSHRGCRCPNTAARPRAQPGQTGSASLGDTGSQRTAARSANSSRLLRAADQSTRRRNKRVRLRRAGVQRFRAHFCPPGAAAGSRVPSFGTAVGPACVGAWQPPVHADRLHTWRTAGFDTGSSYYSSRT